MVEDNHLTTYYSYILALFGCLFGMFVCVLWILILYACGKILHAYLFYKCRCSRLFRDISVVRVVNLNDV